MILTYFTLLSHFISAATFYLSLHCCLNLPLAVCIPFAISVKAFSVKKYAFSKSIWEDKVINLFSKENAMRMR